MPEPLRDDAFSIYPRQMTKQEAISIVNEIHEINSNALVYLDSEKDPVTNAWEVRVAYSGARKVWQEPTGRQHRLNRGILKIASAQEWDDIRAILTKGINAEF